MVFITIAIFAVISVNAYTMRATHGNKSRQVANIIAATQLSLVESVLKVDFHAPTTSIATPLMNSTQFPTYQFVVEDLGYEDAGTQMLRGVRTRVFWTEGGMPKSYELATTFYNY